MSAREAQRKLTGSPIGAGRLEVVLGEKPDGRRAASIPLPYGRASSLHFTDASVIESLIEDLTLAYCHVKGLDLQCAPFALYRQRYIQGVDGELLVI